MSRASGTVLIVAGFAGLAYVLPSGDLTDTDLQSVIVKSPVPAADAPARVVIVPPEPKPAIRPQQAAAEPVPSFSAPVVVTIVQRPSEPAKAAPMPRDRDAIGRELQKELRRVGCYDGELNGAWTTSTKQAMKLFMERVNASLPTDEPDSILLTMVRGYQDRVCGKPCPAGQGLADGGRCVPNAILVRAAPKPPVPVAVACCGPSACARHHRLDDHDDGLRAAGCDAADRRCAARGPHGVSWTEYRDLYDTNTISNFFSAPPGCGSESKQKVGLGANNSSIRIR